VPNVGWMLLTAFALSLPVGIVLAGGGRWRWSWVMVLLAFAPGNFNAEEPKSAGLHWLGLLFLIVSMGPVVLNPVAVEMRSAAWRFATKGMISLTAVFLLWYVLHLPSFGAGDFSSFMIQCMMLGPIVGMGIVIALARAVHGRSWRWGLLALLGFVPLLASGSRVATLAAIAGICFLLIRRKPIFGLGVLVLCASLIYGFMSEGKNLKSSPDSLIGAMARKGDLNSRSGKWESRWLEFKSNPIFGIGIGTATGDGSEKMRDGRTFVEPGSSYLALLAMTGGLGTVAFCSALGLLLFGFIVPHQRGGLDEDILYLVGIYLAVHGVAEGWILSFGGPLCFLFWLWLGRVGDFTLQPLRVNVKRRLGLPRRSGPSERPLHAVRLGGGYDSPQSSGKRAGPPLLAP